MQQQHLFFTQQPHPAKLTPHPFYIRFTKIFQSSSDFLGLWSMRNLFYLLPSFRWKLRFLWNERVDWTFWSVLGMVSLCVFFLRKLIYSIPSRQIAVGFFYFTLAYFFLVNVFFVWETYRHVFWTGICVFVIEFVFVLSYFLQFIWSCFFVKWPNDCKRSTLLNITTYFNITRIEEKTFGNPSHKYDEI